ncbi:hypothetical protein [Actinomyces johnsonii]|nr:hypothetical protein [Actinomyces johnsonii]
MSPPGPDVVLEGELGARAAPLVRETRLAHRPEGCRVYFTGLLP